MVHVRLPYRITLTIGILAVVAGCGRDASRSDVEALRKEVAELKQTQAQMQSAITALQGETASAAGPHLSVDNDPADPPRREAVRRIPTNFAPRKGPEIAAVTVVEFADFQCPFCQAAAGLPDQLLKEFPNEVQFVFKHHPIRRHPQAVEAAKAAWAAHQQGKFWEMHDLIYGGDIQQLGPEVLRGYAEKLDLDMAKFDEDMASNKATQAVSFDKMLGKAIKVGGTPTYFVNGKRVTDNSPGAVRAKVQQELQAFRERAQK